MVSESGDGGEYNGGQGRLSEGKQSSMHMSMSMSMMHLLV